MMLIMRMMMIRDSWLDAYTNDREASEARRAVMGHDRMMTFMMMRMDNVDV